MKRFSILCVCSMITTGAWAQGTVFFYNHILGISNVVVIDAPVTDGIGGPKIDGTNLPDAHAELYAGPAGTAESNLLPVAPAVGFRTGPAAGYFDIGVNGSRAIPGVPAGSNAVVQVRAWTGAGTYEAALTNSAAKAGKSSVLTVTTGGSTNSPSGSLPANLVGLHGFAIAPVGGAPTISLSIQYHTNAVLTLSGISGHTYAIQVKAPLTSTNAWTALATNLVLSGTSTSIVDQQSANAGPRFYRALQTQ
jgi:hypothetical protein